MMWHPELQIHQVFFSFLSLPKKYLRVGLFLHGWDHFLFFLFDVSLCIFDSLFLTG